MKRIVTISIVLATILSVSNLSANGLKDNVAQKATKALNNPSEVKGQAAAKAEVEETRSKELFESKMDKSKFNKEAVADEKKVDTKKTK